MYNVFRKTETGELLAVASLNDLNEAKQLVEKFKEHWPGDYSIQDSVSGREIDLDE